MGKFEFETWYISGSFSNIQLHVSKNKFERGKVMQQALHNVDPKVLFIRHVIDVFNRNALKNTQNTSN